MPELKKITLTGGYLTKLNIDYCRKNPFISDLAFVLYSYSCENKKTTNEIVELWKNKKGKFKKLTIEYEV